MIFADAHCHTNSVKGMGAKGIATKFKQNKGWFIAIIGLSPWHYDLTPNYENYIKAFHHTINECKECKEVGVKTACLVGFHPADLDKLVYKHRLKMEQALNLAFRVLDYAIELCKKGLIDGIGEIGRPHYNIEPRFVVANELIVLYVLRRIKEENLDCIVHLHLEQGGQVTVESIKLFTEITGVNKDKILFHHSRPGLIEHALNNGFPASLPGIKQLIKWGIENLKPIYVLESDFLDDPHRPGVVVYSWEMIEYQQEILSNNKEYEEYLAKININNIVKLYGVELP